MNKKKICVITSSRAEYGLLYWIMKHIKVTNNFKLQLIVTGMHLSQEFGLIFKEIKKAIEIYIIKFRKTEEISQTEP